MNVVSNTSPLTNLAIIGRLDLLAQMYGEITIPEAVWHKLAVKGAHLPSAQQIAAAPWLHRGAACASCRQSGAGVVASP